MGVPVEVPTCSGGVLKTSKLELICTNGELFSSSKSSPISVSEPSGEHSESVSKGKEGLASFLSARSRSETEVRDCTG